MKKEDVSSVLIIKQQKQVLSKEQQTYNRLIKRIEKLQADLDKTSKSLDEKLAFYGKHLFPLEQQSILLYKEMVKQLYPFFTIKKLPNDKQRMALGEIIISHLNNVFTFNDDEPDEELKAIFKSVEGVSYEDAAAEDFEMMKGGMAAMFEEQGFEINFDEMHSKMSKEEMIQKMIEIQEALKQQTEAKEQKIFERKKTKKQLEKEDKEKMLEEARNKNISSIYRQLAKIFHPDLEQDKDRKIEKEALMKQLTSAYEKNDLHTLLRLEIAWIQKEENNPDNLSNEKLSIYNQVLKNQVHELEYKIRMLFENPRYHSLQKLAMYPQQIRNLSMQSEVKKMQSSITEMTGTISILKSNEKAALKEVKNMIEEYQAFGRFEMDFADFFN